MGAGKKKKEFSGSFEKFKSKKPRDNNKKKPDKPWKKR